MTVAPTREEVARAIVRAATPEDLEEARAMRESYLQQNPQDDDIRAMDELLESLAQALAPAKTQDDTTHTEK
jgi:hypothetical protein